MIRSKSFFGYLWASTAILAFVFFVGISQTPVEKLNSIFNIRVSSRITGGEISREIKHENYNTVIHKPVFEGIFSDRKDGFVQIAWDSGNKALPTEINEEIDYDNDGKKDFSVKFDTVQNTASIEKFNPDVKDINKEWIFSYKSKKGIRVGLRKE